VFGSLGDAEQGSPRRLEDLPRAGKDLPGHEERDHDLGQPSELAVTRDEIVLVAAVGVARRVGVVLEEIDVAGDPFLSQPGFGGLQEAFEDALPRLVVNDQVVDRVTFGGRIFRMRSDVEVQPGPVFEEHVRRTPPGNDPAKEIAGDLVRGKPALAPEGAGHAVLVLGAEDASFHVVRIRRWGVPTGNAGTALTAVLRLFGLSRRARRRLVVPDV
jgi:hypothetical protein